MADYLKATEMMNVGVGAMNGGGELAMCPQMKMEYAVGVPNGEGGYDLKDHGFGGNAVMTQGRRWVMNRIFSGNVTGSTAGIGFYLHSATSGAPGVSSVWGDISASNVRLNNSASFETFSLSASSDQTTCTWTTQYTVSQANATVYGGGVIMGSSVSIRTQATAGEVVLYNIGTFANSQALASNNVLSVTVTFSFA